MADRRVTSFNGIELPEVEGWLWAVTGEGVLVASQTYWGGPVASLWVERDRLCVDPPHDFFTAPLEVVKALLEANLG